MPDVSPGDGKPDLARVVELRRASLERAGCDHESAARLAERLEIQLPDALALLRAGFPPDVAVAMLTSGERPVF
jgi:hypothetical protein